VKKFKKKNEKRVEERKKDRKKPDPVGRSKGKKGGA